MSPRLIAAAAAVGVLLALAAGLYWKGRRDGVAQERPKTEAAAADAAAARLEARGERESAQRVEVVVRQREAAARSLAELSEKALKSEDADAPLSPDRADRLRAHDRELCLAAPASCAADHDAGRGGAGVPHPSAS